MCLIHWGLFDVLDSLGSSLMCLIHWGFSFVVDNLCLIVEVLICPSFFERRFIYLFLLSPNFSSCFSHWPSKSSNCSPLSKSIRSWYGWLGISSWKWPTTRRSYMVLKERPTQAVVVMMTVERMRRKRPLLATNQGRGVAIDYPQSQHIYNRQHTSFSFSFFAFNFFLYSL